ncbi:MAG: GAF domain-containing protein [Ruminococcus sp.]
MNSFPTNTQNQERAIRGFLRDYLNKPQDGQKLNNILAGTCKYYDANRSYIFELNKERTEISNTYEWCREGTASEIDSLQHISVDGLECWFDTLDEKGEFCISCLTEEFAPSSKTYQILKPKGVECLAVSALVVNGSVVGFLGVDNPRINRDHLLLLSVIASACCSEIANKRLEDSNSTLKRQMKIIKSMSEIYTSVYYIDLLNNSYTELASIDSVHEHIGQSGNAQRNLDYFCHNMMTAEFTDDLLDFVDLSTLEQRLSNSRIISRQFLSIVPLPENKENIPYWAQCSFIEDSRDMDGRLTHVIFATETIHESKIRELDAKNELQQKNSELTSLLEAEKQHTDIIRSLSNVFFALYYIDIEGNFYQEIFSPDNMHHVCGEKGDADYFTQNTVNISANEEYRSAMNIFTDLSTIDERLRDKPIITQEYVDINGSWVRCSFFPVEKNSAGKNIRVLCGLRNITAEKERMELQDNMIQALSMV